MTTRFISPSKLVSSQIPIVADFTSVLIAGDSLTTAVPTVTCVVYTGIDASPGSVLSGAPTVNTALNQVTQKVIGGIAGVIYEILVNATTTNGYNPSLVTYLAVTQDLP